jgi:hypothetical protein
LQSGCDLPNRQGCSIEQPSQVSYQKAAERAFAQTACDRNLTVFIVYLDEPPLFLGFASVGLL